MQVSQEIDSKGLVNFEERDDAVAVDMLCKYAGVRKEWVDGGSKRVKKGLANIVRSCGRLPVALCVAGKGIRNFGRRSGEDGVGEGERELDVIVKYSEKLERLSHTPVDLGKKGHAEHGGLFGSLEAGLKSGGERWKEREGVREW